MTMKKISQLTEATAVALTDIVEIEAAAGSRKAKKVNMLAPTVESVSANHTIDGREDSRVILMTTGGTNRTCELPDSSTDDVVAGDEFELHKVDAGAGTASLTRQGTDTIDGETSVALYSHGDHARVMYLGGGSYTVLDLKSHGSNANGNWRLEADGTLEQRGDVDNVASSNSSSGHYTSSSLTQTLPTAFYDEDYQVAGAAGHTSTSTGWISFYGIYPYSRTMTSFKYRTANPPTLTADLTWIAVGRWRA